MTHTRSRTSRDGAKRVPRNVRYSPAEWLWMQQKAADKGLTLSDWMRRKTLRGMELTSENYQKNPPAPLT